MKRANIQFIRLMTKSRTLFTTRSHKIPSRQGALLRRRRRRRHRRRRLGWRLHISSNKPSLSFHVP